MHQKYSRFTVCCLAVMGSLMLVYTVISSKQQTLIQSLQTISIEKNDYRKLQECLEIINSEKDVHQLKDIVSKPLTKTTETVNNDRNAENINVENSRITQNAENFRITQKPSVFPTERKCSHEKTNIAFLKTHKTAGSTITNIVSRFGFYRNLTFVLPFKKLNQERFNYIGGQGGTIDAENIIPILPGETYNILCNHVVYNATAFENILPNDTFLFTILREPFSQFISTLNYYGNSNYGYMADFLNVNSSNPVREYLQTPWKYEPTDPHYSMTNNKMAIDLGMPIAHLREGRFILSYIEILKNKFQLVLLQEHFDESLILLKRHTCWSFKDIIHISHNIWPLRREFNLLPEDIDKHRMWNIADYTLYETFYKIFWDKVLQEKDFFNEVYHFKQIQHRVLLHCSKEYVAETLTIHRSTWSAGFIVTPEDCVFIKTKEVEFLSILHNSMMNRFDPNGQFSFEEDLKQNLF